MTTSISDFSFDILKKLVKEKETFVDTTSEEAIDILSKWYQQVINDLMESQIQIIDEIQNERDRAKNDLFQYETKINDLKKKFVDKNEFVSIESKFDELKSEISHYDLIKDISLPDYDLFQPRYKLIYRSKNSDDDDDGEEENWDCEEIPLPSNLILSTASTPSAAATTTTSFFPDLSQIFIEPPNDEDELDVFDWKIDSNRIFADDEDFLLNSNYYRRAESRHFDSDIHLIASNGHDLLCFSNSSKQLIYQSDANSQSIVLPWYHGVILQLVWFDVAKCFVALTDENNSNLFSIDLTSTGRLKIRLRTSLPKHRCEILRNSIFLRADSTFLFVFYQRNNGEKRFRSLNRTFEYERSYLMNRCFQSSDVKFDGNLLGLATNQNNIVFFGESNENLILLIFTKSSLSFVRRLVVPNIRIRNPFLIHFASVSSFAFVDQFRQQLRYFHHEYEIGQIDLEKSRDEYSSFVLMNDASLIFAHQNKDLVQFILTDNMTTVRALHEDALYAILPHCSSSIDMWNFLLALDFSPEQISNLRAFWSQTRLTSFNLTEENIFDFVKQIAMFTVELRLDHLNWINTANLRRILSYFRILIRFHTGNVALSRRTLTHDVAQLFPFIKFVHLLVLLADNGDEHFQDLCSSLASIKQLKQISLLLEEEKRICFSNRSAKNFLNYFSNFLGNWETTAKLVSIEENFDDFHQRFYSWRDGVDANFSRAIELKFPSTLKHLILNFRPMFNVDFILKTQAEEIETLVLPNFPSICDKKIFFENLKIFHVGFSAEKIRSSPWFCSALRSKMRNLTFQLDDSTPVRLSIDVNSNEFLFEFSSTTNFQMEIPVTFFRHLTNLNFTGLHFHSADFQNLFDEIQNLRSLSLSPCSIFLLDPTNSQWKILRFNKNLCALNFVSDEKQMKNFCSILNSNLTFEQICKTSIRTAFQQLDLLHFSVRFPNYQIQREDFLLNEKNHLETLIFDMKTPVNFHAILAEQFALKRFEKLRRFFLLTPDEFQLTELLFDRFSLMETIEIISSKSILKRPMIKYIERVLQPTIYRNLNEFSFQFGSVDAQHLLKQMNKKIRLRFSPVRPAFQFQCSLVSAERKSILYDHKHPIHRFFHSISTRNSRQISFIFPSYLNYFPLYNEMIFDDE